MIPCPSVFMSKKLVDDDGLLNQLRTLRQETMMRVFVIQYFRHSNDDLAASVSKLAPGSEAKLGFFALEVSGSQKDLDQRLEEALASKEPLVVVCGQVFHGKESLGCSSGTELTARIKERRPDAYAVMYTATPPYSTIHLSGIDALVKKDELSRARLAEWLVHLVTTQPPKVDRTPRGDLIEADGPRKRR